MNWKHASMSGTLTWVRGRLSPLPHLTLYSELSPTLIVGFTARGGCPAEYLKFSTVVSVTCEVSNTITLHYRNGTQISLIAPNAEECNQWFHAIHLALAGCKMFLASTAKSSPVTKQHGRETTSIASNCSDGFLKSMQQREFFYNDNKISSGRVNHENDSVSDETSATAHITDSAGFATQRYYSVDATQPVSKALFSDISPKLSPPCLKEEGIEEQTQQILPVESVTLSQFSLNSVVGCQPAELGVKPVNPSHISSAVEQDSSTPLCGTLGEQSEDYSVFGDYVHHLSCSAASRNGLKMNSKELTKKRQSSASFIAPDDFAFTGYDNVCVEDDALLELRRGPSSTVSIKTELFGSPLSQKTYGSFLPKLTSMSENKGKTNDGDNLLRPHVDTFSANSTRRRSIVAPAPHEILLSDLANLDLPLQGMTASTPPFNHSSMLKTTVVEDDTAGREGTTKEKSLCFERRHKNELWPQMPWRSSEDLALLLNGQNKTQELPRVRPDECFNCNIKNSHNNGGCDAKERRLAESIIDRIIGTTPRSTPRDDLPSVVLLPGIDTPPSRLLSRERGDFYCPVEAAVAAVPRRGRSGVRCVLERSVSMDGEWRRSSNNHFILRDSSSLRLQSVRPFVERTYLSSNRGD